MPLIILLLGQVAGADVPTIAATIGASCAFSCPRYSIFFPLEFSAPILWLFHFGTAPLPRLYYEKYI